MEYIYSDKDQALLDQAEEAIKCYKEYLLNRLNLIHDFNIKNYELFISDEHMKLLNDNYVHMHSVLMPIKIIISKN